MPDVKQSLETIWTSMNPSEPSPAYLAKVMASAVVLFTVALFLGPIL